jgi:hypothetical protein
MFIYSFAKLSSTNKIISFLRPMAAEQIATEVKKTERQKNSSAEAAIAADRTPCCHFQTSIQGITVQPRGNCQPR